MLASSGLGGPARLSPLKGGAARREIDIFAAADSFLEAGSIKDRLGSKPS